MESSPICVRGSPPQMCAIGDLFFDAQQQRLFEADREVALRPKSLILLSYLVQHRGRLVPKSELIEAVWPDTFITENSLAQCLTDLRRAFGDRWRSMIKTVPRRGYLLKADQPEMATETMRRMDYGWPENNIRAGSIIRRRMSIRAHKARQKVTYVTRPLRGS
jgi:DNA-binding winged helix-turn-helix (wHTH) protein